MRVLCFGEILWDIFENDQHLGGAPLNFAAHLARHGEEVALLSAVGKDVLGEEAVKQVAAWHISTAYLAQIEDKETGKCLVTLSKQAIPQYTLLPDVAYDHIRLDNTPAEFDVLYFGTLALRSPSNQRLLENLLAERQFSEVFVDVNIRPPFSTPQALRFSLEKATILKISEEEAETVADWAGLGVYRTPQHLAMCLTQHYPHLKHILITQGANGAFAYDCAYNQRSVCYALAVPVCSTVGAGDAFSAAFLHKYGQKTNAIGICLEYATRVAGYVVTRQEAVPEYTPADFL